MNIEREREIERVSFLKINLFLFYRSRLLKYCMIVLLKSVGASTENNTINHIYYAEKHANKHSLAHTIILSNKKKKIKFKIRKP
jgi:hypothetical protein